MELVYLSDEDRLEALLDGRRQGNCHMSDDVVVCVAGVVICNVRLCR